MRQHATTPAPYKTTVFTQPPRLGQNKSAQQLTRELFETKAELAAVTQQRDELLKKVSHDLKNPLTAILVSSSLLQERVQQIEGDEGTKLARLGASLRNSGMRMNDMIDRMVDVFRVRAGNLKTKQKVEDIVSILAEAVDSALPSAQAYDVRLEQEPLETSAQIICDRKRMLQVLGAIFNNAIRFSGAGGLVRLKAAVSDAHLTITIADSGPGIPKDKRDELFQYGIKGENGPGSGSSLFLASGVIALHGGEIWVDGSEGAAFHVKLPLD